MAGHYGSRYPGSRFPQFHQHVAQNMHYSSQNYQGSHHVYAEDGSYEEDPMASLAQSSFASGPSYYQDGSFDVESAQNGQFFSHQNNHEPSPIASWSTPLDRPPPVPRIPPREQRAHRQKPPPDRDSRSATPEPVRSPSPSYLSLAHEHPSTLNTPSSLRKLLILDLNGTLVFRSPFSKGKPAPADRSLDANGRPLPALRPVHPRPYMKAFREYLSCEETRRWLDVMVWSSAQPHSVQDMVEQCFGEEKENLVAVWARDTLGLSQDRYYRKVQTVKDLTKPWTELPAFFSPPSSSGASSPPPSSQPLPSSPPSSRTPTPPGLRPPTQPSKSSANAHSALTTLLLDDSPAKAALQPHNHVCIPEYSAALRSKDVQNLEKEREWERALEVREAVAAGEIALSAGKHTQSEQISIDDAADTPDEQSTAGSSPERTLDATDTEMQKRKRREKKLRKRAAKLDGAPATRPVTEYDTTLLAVVGVLEEVKRQANVAAWICAGGLWGPSVELVEGKRKESLSPGAEREGKRQKLRAPSESSQPSARADTPATSCVEAGNDETAAVATADPSAQSDDRNNQEAKSSDGDKDKEVLLWFEHPATLAYWAERGQKALEELAIEVVHGLER